MAIKTGICNTFGLGKEATFGAGAAATIWIPSEDFEVNPELEYEEDDNAFCRLEKNAGGISVVSQTGMAKSSGKIRQDSFGALLMAAFGKVTTTAGNPEAGVNTHLFEVKTIEPNDPISYQIETGMGSMSDAGLQQVKGAVLDSLSLEFNQKESCKFSADFKSLAPNAGTNNALIALVEKAFTTEFVEIKIADTVADLAAAPILPFISASASIGKDVQVDIVGGGAEIYPKEFAFGGSIELSVQNDDYIGYTLNDTRKAMSIKLVNTKTTVGASTNPYLEFIMPEVSFSEWAFNGGMRDKSTQTFDFTAGLSVAEGYWVNATLVNEYAGY